MGKEKREKNKKMKDRRGVGRKKESEEQKGMIKR